MRVPLQYPVDVDGKHYDSVELRRVRGKDMRVMARYAATLDKIRENIAANGDGGDTGQAPGDEIEATLAIIASVTDLPQTVVDEFDLEDIGEIASKMQDFFPETSPALSNGARSSPRSRRS